MSDSKQYCSFFVEDLYFGVEVRAVQEVIRYQDMTPIPLASGEVGGLINLRGQIVTAIDLRRRLGLAERDAQRRPMNVVIRTDDGAAVSLLVDEIGDVIEVDQAQFEPVPETLRGVARQLIQGVYKLQGRLLLVLDTAAAVHVVSSMDVTMTATESVNRAAVGAAA
jgi:purine-binding chemotaxis protein CheW